MCYFEQGNLAKMEAIFLFISVLSQRCFEVTIEVRIHNQHITSKIPSRTVN